MGTHTRFGQSPGSWFLRKMRQQTQRCTYDTIRREIIVASFIIKACTQLRMTTYEKSKENIPKQWMITFILILGQPLIIATSFTSHTSFKPLKLSNGEFTLNWYKSLVMKYSIMEFNPTQDRLGLRLLSCTSKGHITPREKLVVKLGTMIPVFGCLPFFTKYLDQQAITNAYVSYVDCTPGVADNPCTHTP